MFTADDITDYLLSKEIKMNGKSITNLDVQKILYFAQGWHLAINGERLFQEKLRAWVHGPVVPEIYFRLAQYERDPIPVLNHPLIFPIVKSMPSRSMGNRLLPP
jgi:uncharacterized phage-associated protein